uniref:Uncharacterized protein n=1 Tax=Anguilla anguilla TaxID=7936 RepID=A0A0E9R4U5_ANGAN
MITLLINIQMEKIRVRFLIIAPADSLMVVNLAVRPSNLFS